MPPSSTISSKISSKGQITVPMEIRQRLGLKQGDRVEFIFEDDRTVVRPARSDENPFEKFRGIAPLPEGLDSVRFWREMRGHEPDEDVR